jgi:hypothetical protein
VDADLNRLSARQTNPPCSRAACVVNSDPGSFAGRRSLAPACSCLLQLGLTSETRFVASANLDEIHRHLPRSNVTENVDVAGVEMRGIASSRMG